VGDFAGDFDGMDDGDGVDFVDAEGVAEEAVAVFDGTIGDPPRPSLKGREKGSWGVERFVDCFLADVDGVVLYIREVDGVVGDIFYG